MGKTKIFLRAELFKLLTQRFAAMLTAGRVLLRYVRWRRNMVNLRKGLKKAHQIYAAQMAEKEAARMEALALVRALLNTNLLPAP